MCGERTSCESNKTAVISLIFALLLFPFGRKIILTDGRSTEHDQNPTRLNQRPSLYQKEKGKERKNSENKISKQSEIFSKVSIVSVITKTSAILSLNIHPNQDDRLIALAFYIKHLSSLSF